MSIMSKITPLVSYSRKTVGCVPLNASNARGIISSLLFIKIKVTTSSATRRMIIGARNLTRL